MGRLAIPSLLTFLAAAPLALAAAEGHAQSRAVELTLALGGDVIFDAPIEYVLRVRARSEDDPHAYDELFEDLAGPLSHADLAIVNLETPVGERTRSRGEDHDYPTFAAPPAFLSALRAAGVDLVTVANNHAYDQGVGGLAETLGHAQTVGLDTSGATGGARGYALTTVRGIRVATVSLTQGTNHRVERGEPAAPRVHFFDEARLRRLVADARAHADVVLVALHFTDTGERLPTRGMERWSLLAAEAGADLVVGHGPHRPARLEWVEVSGRRVPLLYSLGNLVAAMRAEEHAERADEVHVRDAVLVEARVRLAEGRVSIESITPHAFWIDDARGTGGRAPFTRPLSIAHEVARAPGSRAAALQARGARIEALFDRLPATGSQTTLTRSTPALTPPTATAPPREPRPEITAPPPAAASRSAPGTTPASADFLGATFRCGSAMETAVDEEAMRAWVGRLRAEPSLQLELVSERCEGEPPSLAERRARRAAGLIAIRGPSRSRFVHRAGERASADAPRIAVRALTLSRP